MPCRVISSMSLNINISGVKFAGFSSLGNTCLLFTSNKKILSLTPKNVASLERFSPHLEFFKRFEKLITTDFTCKTFRTCTKALMMEGGGFHKTITSSRVISMADRLQSVDRFLKKDNAI